MCPRYQSWRRRLKIDTVRHNEMASERAATLRRVCVFSGSSAGNDPLFAQIAAQLGEQLAKRNITLVYGGGSVGLMGACSSHVQQAGGHIISVIPEPLAPRELSGQSRGHVFFTQEMHSRKQIMMHLSDAFIALPGGLGTYEEVLDATTWSKLGIHSKPTGLLNISGFFDGLLEQVETSISYGFTPATARSSICSNSDPNALLDQLSSMLGNVHAPVDAPEWPLSDIARQAAAEVDGLGF